MKRRDFVVSIPDFPDFVDPYLVEVFDKKDDPVWKFTGSADHS